MKLSGGWEWYRSPQICFLKWNHRLRTLSGRRTKKCFLNVLCLKYFNRASMQSYRRHDHTLLRACSKRTKGVHHIWESYCALPYFFTVRDQGSCTMVSHCYFRRVSSWRQQFLAHHVLLELHLGLSYLSEHCTLKDFPCTTCRKTESTRTPGNIMGFVCICFYKCKLKTQSFVPQEDPMGVRRRALRLPPPKPGEMPSPSWP